MYRVGLFHKKEKKKKLKISFSSIIFFLMTIRLLESACQEDINYNIISIICLGVVEQQDLSVLFY